MERPRRRVNRGRYTKREFYFATIAAFGLGTLVGTVMTGLTPLHQQTEKTIIVTPLPAEKPSTPPIPPLSRGFPNRLAEILENPFMRNLSDVVNPYYDITLHYFEGKNPIVQVVEPEGMVARFGPDEKAQQVKDEQGQTVTYEWGSKFSTHFVVTHEEDGKLVGVWGCKTSEREYPSPNGGKYPLLNCIALSHKGTVYAKFDETVEPGIKVRVNNRHNPYGAA